MDNFDVKNESSDNLNTSTFYSESYKKPASRKKNGVFQLVLVALISSIFGGLMVGSLFFFVAPNIQTPVKGYFEKFMQNKSAVNSTAAQNNVQVPYKKVEIVQNSDSVVTAIAEKVGPSVVGIKVTVNVQDFFFGDRQMQPEGSGIIIRSDGYILTNNHVIQDAIDARTKKISSDAKIEVYLPSAKDKAVKATFVGSDAKTDLAVLKVDMNNLPAAELGNSDDLKVGDMAVAIGNPGGLELAGSLTAGVISGLNRTIQTEDGVQLKLIQTDAAINPGNSGGALVNAKGQIIGVNRLKIAASGFEGLGFAIPINVAKQVSTDLIESKYVKGRPLLGITPDPRYTEEVAKRNNMPVGVYVAEVALMSGAQKAGVQAGDVITKIDGVAVKNRDELDAVKNKHKVGDEVPLEIFRDGNTITLKVKLSEDKG